MRIKGTGKIDQQLTGMQEAALQKSKSGKVLDSCLENRPVPIASAELPESLYYTQHSDTGPFFFHSEKKESLYKTIYVHKMCRYIVTY